MSRSGTYPPKAEAWNGAQLAIRNADYHRSCADILAQHQKFGAAVSHLVLATEEAIKSVGFLMAAIGIPLPAQDAQQLLVNHRARHQLAALLHIVNDFTLRVLAEGATPTQEEFPDPNFLYSFIESMLSGWSDYVAGPHEAEILDDSKWWQTANSLKQAGMYVDYSTMGWETPGSIHQSEYERSAAVVDRFFDQFDKPIRPWIEADSEIQDLLCGWFEPIIARLNSGGAELVASIVLDPKKLA